MKADGGLAGLQEQDRQPCRPGHLLGSGVPHPWGLSTDSPQWRSWVWGPERQAAVAAVLGPVACRGLGALHHCPGGTCMRLVTEDPSSWPQRPHCPSRGNVGDRFGTPQSGCSWVGEAPGLHPPFLETSGCLVVLRGALSWPEQAGGSGGPECLRDGSLAGRGHRPVALVSRRARPAVPGRAPWPELTPCPPPAADLVAGPRADLRQRQALRVHPGPLRLQPLLLPVLRHARGQVHLLGCGQGQRPAARPAPQQPPGPPYEKARTLPASGS